MPRSTTIHVTAPPKPCCLFRTPRGAAILSLSGLAVDPANTSLLYLIAVLLSAVSAGIGPGIAASVASFLSYNFFFVEPHYVFSVGNPQDLARLLSFLLVALIASAFAGVVRDQVEERARLAALVDATQVLAESDRLKSALILSVSHDLRAPLTTILGMATELQEVVARDGTSGATPLAAAVVEEATR